MMKNYKFWLTMAIIFQILTGLIHSLSFFSNPLPNNDREEQLLNLMTGYKFDLGAGYLRSMNDLFTSLSIAFMLFFIFGGILNWYLLRNNIDVRVMKGVIMINVFFFGICLLAMMFFAFLPPIVLNGLVFICLVGAFFTIRK